MREYLTLGSVPYNEPTISLEAPNKYQKKECLEYKRMLEDEFPHAEFGIKQFYHDFGPYREVVVYFDEDDEDEVHTAFFVESNCPDSWDEEAKENLGEEYFKMLSNNGF